MAHLVECLSCMHEALGSIPSTTENWTWWYMSEIPALGRWRWEDQKFKGSLASRVSLGHMRTFLKKLEKKRRLAGKELQRLYTQQHPWILYHTYTTERNLLVVGQASR